MCVSSRIALCCVYGAWVYRFYHGIHHQPCVDHVIYFCGAPFVLAHLEGNRQITKCAQTLRHNRELARQMGACVCGLVFWNPDYLGTLF